MSDEQAGAGTGKQARDVDYLTPWQVRVTSPLIDYMGLPYDTLTGSAQLRVPDGGLPA